MVSTIQDPAKKVLFILGSFASLMEGIIRRTRAGVSHFQGSFYKGSLGAFVTAILKTLGVQDVEIVLLDLMDRSEQLDTVTTPALLTHLRISSQEARLLSTPLEHILSAYLWRWRLGTKPLH